MEPCSREQGAVPSEQRIRGRRVPEWVILRTHSSRERAPSRLGEPRARIASVVRPVLECVATASPFLVGASTKSVGRVVVYTWGSHPLIGAPTWIVRWQGWWPESTLRAWPSAKVVTRLGQRGYGRHGPNLGMAIPGLIATPQGSAQLGGDPSGLIDSRSTPLPPRSSGCALIGAPSERSKAEERWGAGVGLHRSWNEESSVPPSWSGGRRAPSV
jgi:hypothetical protein